MPKGQPIEQWNPATAGISQEFLVKMAEATARQEAERAAQDAAYAAQRAQIQAQIQEEIAANKAALKGLKSVLGKNTEGGSRRMVTRNRKIRRRRLIVTRNRTLKRKRAAL